MLTKTQQINFLKFIPVYKERIWGGNNLESFFHRPLPKNKLIGESWDIVDRDDAQSLIEIDPHTKVTLRELLYTHPESIMGPLWPKHHPFPILVKWLDCSQNLSVQVHPYSPPLSKTENWYIAHAEPQSHIITGFNHTYSKEEIKKFIETHQLEDKLNYIPTSSGDSILITSGTVHAIGAGHLILEIQQNSDTTYRLHDWNRLDTNGLPRKLHIHESLESINYNHLQPELLKTEGQSMLLANCPYFNLTKYTLTPHQILSFKSHEEPRILSIIHGTLQDQTSQMILNAGDNILLPYDQFFDFKSLGKSTILITNQFNKSTL